MAEKKNAQDVAKGYGLEELDTEGAVQMIAHDILITMHRAASESNNKKRVAQIENVYKEWYPQGKFHDDGSPINSVLLMGPPGQGKTTAFKVAAKQVAQALGMNYLENGAIDAKMEETGGITDNDFVFVSQETAGVVSSLEWAGLPTSKIQLDPQGKERKVMGRLYSTRLQAIADAGGGLLLLDDFMNASPSIQNVGLSLTEEKRYGDLSLSKAYVGLTGNMGSVDGTHTTKISAALRNRCQIFFTQDKFQNFVKRVNADPRYRDEVGDVGVCGFLERYQQYFASMPDPKLMGGYNTPRSWDKFIAEARRAVYTQGGRQGALRALKTIQSKAASLLGHEVAHQYTTYLRSMMDLADPLARDVILHGKLDKDTLKKKFNEGYSASEQHFAYQYALALADYSAIKIVNDKGDLKEAVTRFAMGLTVLDGSSFTFGINAFKSKLANQFESLSDKRPDGTRELNEKSKIEIAKIVAAHPQCTKQQIQNMVDALSNTDKTSGMKSSRSRRS